LNSSYSQLPQHGPLEPQPELEVCAADADALGLAEGAMARVWNHRAALELPVRITARVRSGVVAVPWGWWAQHHGGADAPVANSLTSDAATDWGGGVAFWDTAVAVDPVRS
jgi:anaerobic selenocysteine-containing dehydrogenase